MIGARLFAVVFLAAIAVVTIGTAARLITSMPSRPAFVSWRHLPAQFESMVNEHLLGRALAMSTNARLRVEALGISTTPQVWIGADGWLFYNHGATLGPSYSSPAGIALTIDHWDRLMRWRRDWCRSRGLPLGVVLVPDKQTVYPERLPASARRRSDSSVLDRVLGRWSAESAIRFADLRAEFQSAKSGEPLFWRSDSHWTPFGCWLGCERTVALLDELTSSNVPPSPALVAERLPFHPGDLWRMLGLSEPAPAETCLRLGVREPRAVRTNEIVPLSESDRLSHLRPAVWERPDSLGPRVVLLCDSFADERFQELLAERCRRLVVVPTYEFPQSLIERERPDAVVIEMVERALICNRPRVARP